MPLKELGVMTRKCKVKPLGKREFQIILTQGYNRQIRRMCEYFGYRVEKLVRTRIMNITLGDLPEGTYRKVTDGEWKELREMIRNSSGTTVIPKGNERGEKGNGSGGKNKNRRIKKKIEYHSNLYYNEDNPEITDYEFDQMMQELKKLERKIQNLQRRIPPQSG